MTSREVQASRRRARPHGPRPLHAHRGNEAAWLGQLRSPPGTGRRRRAFRTGLGDLDDLLPDVPSGLPTDGSRASMAPGADHGQVWLATIDSGRATGDPRERRYHHVPDALRANVGLLALFKDARNHLSCKIEVSALHPQGLISRGSAERRLGLPAGTAAAHRSRERLLHLELTAPPDLSTILSDARVK